MSDIVLEYTSIPPARFDRWRNVLRDVGFARGYGPSEGQPGYREYERQAARAIELLQPHLNAMTDVVDTRQPFVLAHMESILRAYESSRQPADRRDVGDVSLDLADMMSSLEVLLLNLIGPEGQSPIGPGQIELPTQPYFEAWLAASTGCLNLLPNVESTQTIAWRTDRAYLLPHQVRKIAEMEARDVSFRTCCAILQRWNSRSSTKVWVGSEDPAEQHRYEIWQAAFTEGLVQLQAGLTEAADRGEVYLGWTTWSGYE